MFLRTAALAGDFTAGIDFLPDATEGSCPASASPWKASLPALAGPGSSMRRSVSGRYERRLQGYEAGEGSRLAKSRRPRHGGTRWAMSAFSNQTGETTA